MARSLSTALILSFSSIAACGRVGYEPLPGSPPADMGTTDAPVIDMPLVDMPVVDMPMDAPPPDGGCVLGPWEAPALLTVAGTATATLFGGPSPSPDRRTLYFSMTLSGGSEDLYFATRADTESSSFASLTSLTALNMASVEGAPAITPDDLALYFFSDRVGTGVGGRDLYYATRATSAGSFGTVMLVPNVNGTGVDQAAGFTADGLTLVWSSERAGSAASDMYLATRASTTATFGSIRRISELASANSDTTGGFASDGLTLYYASGRAGTTGGLDVWEATRGDTAGSSLFSTPSNITILNSGNDEFDVRVSVDGREMFFGSNRSGPSRLYHSFRRCL